MIVCVVGMHRSGTSMVARMLKECGLYLGDEKDLIQAAEDNTEGFWENIKFLNLNEEILSEMGGSWDIPPVLDAGWEVSPRLVNTHIKASNLIEQFSSESNHWGWKDPRSSLTIPFWKRNIPDLKIVFCLRNPYEVHRSLTKRGYASSHFSYSLWVKYNQQVLWDTSPKERIITHFDSFFSDPYFELRRLINFIGLNVSDETIQTACKSISIKARHNQSSIKDLRASSVPDEVLCLYGELCYEAGLASGEEFVDSIFNDEAGVTESKEIGFRQKERLLNLGNEFKIVKRELEELRFHHANLQKELEKLRKNEEDIQAELAQIVTSRGWQFVLFLRKIRVFFAPIGSRREKTLKVLYRILGIRLFFKSILVLHREGVRGLLHRIRNQASNTTIPPLDINGYKKFYGDLFAAAKGQPWQKDEYVEISNENYSADETSIKTIAFYLPQFHPIPENDEWWGKGFTEWTNVSKAVPQFEGHYQPHLPGELGFYDLRVPDVQKRQIELARMYGIYGFAFHYYWFNGKQLLEKPLELFLKSKDDFPFCICWANENWTRRWDGLEDHVLIAQSHSQESDLRFIEDVSPLFRDKRYIRINGRPLLIVYRTSIIPNISETVAMWRDYCVKRGFGNPYLVAAQTFWFSDPREVDFDAALEFPPNNVTMTEINDRIQVFNPEYKGHIYDYQEVIKSFSDKPRPDYKLFRTVFPGWDNEARKPGNGNTFAFSTPELYKKWLFQAASFTLGEPDPEKRILFINAWNEWSEGAHLEPDRKYGYAYLQATTDVLRTIDKIDPRFFYPVIVFQPGKVGSMSVMVSLEKKFAELNISTQIHHVHVLEDIDQSIALVTKERKNPEDVIKNMLEKKELRKQIEDHPHQPWNIISLVRDPVAQRISFLFQAFDQYIPDWQEKLESGRFSLTELQKLFYEGEEFTNFHRLSSWFDRQIKPIWNIDVYSIPFPKNKGYQIYNNGLVSLLIIRLEDLNRVAKRAFDEFMGVKDFSIVSTNVGKVKPYHKLYEQFKKLPVSSSYLDTAYATRYARHFYTDKEIEAFRKRWLFPS